MKEEEVEVDETFSIRFEDPIPVKRIKQEPVEERKDIVIKAMRKAFAEVATQTETFETDVEVLKSEIQNLKQRVDSGFKEANERMTSEIKNLQQRVDSGFREVIERMARNQETIEKSDGLNPQQTGLVKSKVNSEVDKNQPDSNVKKPRKVKHVLTYEDLTDKDFEDILLGCRKCPEFFSTSEELDDHVKNHVRSKLAFEGFAKSCIL